MRRVVAGLGALALIGLGAAAWLRHTPRAPSSVLLVTIDTLRADRVGAYGSTRGLTPALDELAAALAGLPAEQRTALEGLGCDEMQGYLHGRPMPFDEYERCFLND